MSFQDRAFKPVKNRCDLCDDPIQCHEDIEITKNILTEIDDSFKSEYDKHDPRLLLFDYCQKGSIPGYQLT
jgi:hypothetical protein